MNHIEHVFKLKGTREYVHGTDIYAFLLRNLWAETQRVSNIGLAFSHRIENTACVCQWSDQEGELDMRAAPCRGKYDVDGVAHYFCISPEEEDGPRERVDYNETEMSAAAIVSKKGAAMEINPKYTFIENLVALTKHFHNTHYKPDSNQWMFGKLELDAIPNNVVALEIGLRGMVAGKLSSCSIAANGTNVGSIFFTIG